MSPDARRPRLSGSLPASALEVPSASRSTGRLSRLEEKATSRVAVQAALPDELCLQRADAVLELLHVGLEPGELVALLGPAPARDGDPVDLLVIQVKPPHSGHRPEGELTVTRLTSSADCDKARTSSAAGQRRTDHGRARAACAAAARGERATCDRSRRRGRSRSGSRRARNTRDARAATSDPRTPITSSPARADAQRSAHARRAPGTRARGMAARQHEEKTPWIR